MIRKLIAGTALGLTLMAPAASAEGLSIAFISHSSASNTFWQAVKKGYDDACEKVGASCQLILTQTEGAVEQAVANLQAAIASRPDAIFVAIVDNNAYDNVIKEAVDAGILVLAVNVDDSEGAKGNARKAFIGQGFTAAGYSLAKAQSETSRRRARSTCWSASTRRARPGPSSAPAASRNFWRSTRPSIPTAR